MYALLAQLVEQ